jgi:tRNA(fMet)-specific endonuclease VapC
VSLGELKSIALMNNWGENKIQKLEQLFDELLVADIHNEKVVEKYAEIDAFSQGKLKKNPLSFSSRNMGKNDLWIAATASSLSATLLTSDGDFEHLDSTFLKVAKFAPNFEG